MQITFIKQKDKKNTISCKRKDGSATWMASDLFYVQHDLMHFAVETKLGYKTAFYGMLAGGIDITDFELPKAQRNFEYTEQAWHAESIVNLLFIQLKQGENSDFQTALNAAYIMNAYPFSAPVVSAIAATEIKNLFQELWLQWNELAYGEALHLLFEE